MNMNNLTSLATSGSTRRLIALLVGLAAIALDKHFGLQLTELDKEAITVLVTAFLAQSAWKEATLAKVEAAGAAAAATMQATPAPSRLDFLKAQLAEEEARVTSGQKAP